MATEEIYVPPAFVNTQDPVVFISFRFCEAEGQGVKLKEALEANGIRTFLCAVNAGDDIMGEVARNLRRSKLVVIMGSRTYSKKTKSACSTYEEMQYVMNEKRPFFLVKMCDSFEEDLAAVFLNPAVATISGLSMSACRPILFLRLSKNFAVEQIQLLGYRE
jgi:hypothetical protein